MTKLALFFLCCAALQPPPCRAVQVCGNYCGPGWCNGRSLDESKCDGTVAPDALYAGVDGCCRSHDACCGHGNRSVCNGEIIACIQNLYGASLTDNRWETSYEWVKRHFQYPIACGTRAIGEFFDIMGIMSSVFYGRDMCCGTLCGDPQ